MKITIKAKLLIGFLVILALMGFSSILGIMRLSGMNNRLNQISRVSSEKVKIGARVNQDALAVSRAEKNIILSKDQTEMDEYASFIAESRDRMQERREELRELADKEGKAQLDEFAETWDRYLEVNDEVRELSRENSNNRAKEISAGKARTAFDKAAAAIHAIVEKNENEASNAQEMAGLRLAAEKMKLGARIKSNLLEIQRGEKNMILAATEEEMQEYAQAIQAYREDLNARVAQLENLVTGSARAELDDFSARYQNYLSLHEQVKELTLQNTNNRAFDLATGKGRELNDKALDQMAGIVEMNEADMARDVKASDENYAAARRFLLILLAVSIALGVGVAIWVILGISRGLSNALSVVKTISQGDLDADVRVTTRDEIGDLLGDMKGMVSSLQEKGAALEQIAQKDLSIAVNKISDRDTLGESLYTMKSDLNVIMKQISESVSQVSEASDQVSQASQSLSQGATEQASSLEEISSSATEVNSQSKQNAENANEANALAKKASEDADTGSKQMNNLISAMNAISSSSDEIKKVVKVIDDIAFQINLLALNANVEAARAGKYGKGFAVVAEEVRNLATRSTDAVNETTAMVDDVVGNIESGNKAAQETGQQLSQIVEGVSQVAEYLSEIASASGEQAEAIDQVTGGLDQVDQVTQSNTASAEETASAAEELSSMSQELYAMIDEFKLDGKQQYKSEQLLEAPQENTENQEANRGRTHEASAEETGVKPVKEEQEYTVY